MRRTAFWSGLVVACGLGLSGNGTAAQELGPEGFQIRRARVARRGPVGMEVGSTAGGIQPDRGPSRRKPGPAADSPRFPQVHHAPLPGPEMPFAASDELREPRAPAVSLDPPPLLARDFLALPDNGASIPPDTHGAVGWDKVMTVLNTEVRVQDRLGGVDSTVSLNGFWGGVSTAGVFDPRVAFDPDPAWGGRWIWAAVQGARLPSSGVLLGVSLGASPNLGNGLLIDAAGDDTIWADYPNVGFNKKWIVVQVNMFLTADDSWDSSYLYVFDKAKLYQNIPTSPMVIFSDVDGSTWVPALTYDFTAEELYLLQTWNSGAGVLRLYELTGAVDSAVITPLGFPLAPGWVDTQGPADFAPQAPGCAAACEPNCKIQTNDARIQNVVFRDGSLWATQTIFLAGPDRSSVQWWEIDPGDPANPKQIGLIDDAFPGELFYAFPSLSVNRLGDVMLGYSAFEGGAWAGARYSFRYRGDPPGSMRTDGTVKDGDACYYKILTGSRNRWGDYSATVVDPSGEVQLWTVQEYAAVPSGEDKWGTWWGMLDPTRTISITDVSVNEGDAGPTAMTFTLTLSAPTPDTVTVKWSTDDDTATVADSDYVAVTNQLVTFPPDTVSRDVTVTVNGDIRYEGDETLLVNLTDPSNATLAVNQATGTIFDDDRPRISISDPVAAEGTPPPAPPVGRTSFPFLVTLSNPSDSPVQVTWSTVIGGSAQDDDSDYIATGGVVTFTPGDVEETVIVEVNWDIEVEVDETFHVQLTTPTGADILKGLGIGVIVNDDVVEPPVRGLAVVSDWEESPVSKANNHLQWLNPAGIAPVQILVGWQTSASPCAVYPTNPGAGTPVTFGTAGQSQSWDHLDLTVGTYYCYTVWIDYGAGNYSTGANGMAQPFDADDPLIDIEWKYYTGIAALAPPTVGFDAVLAPANDNVVHAMTRGDSGGAWPAGWRPPSLGSPAQQRSPIVPLGGVSRGYYSTQDGRVHAVDTSTGALLWSSQLAPAASGGAPAGIFVEWGGIGDYVLVGTTAGSNNAVYALDPFTGAVLDKYPNGTTDPAVDIGPIYSMPAVDYGRKRLYFASWASGSPETLWCLELGPSSDPLKHGWKMKDNFHTTPVTFGDITGSPVLRGDRLYVGADSGVIWAVDVTDASDTGGTVYEHDTSRPGAIPFIWPDRNSDRLYFPVSDAVLAIDDDGAAFSAPVWTVPAINPSAVLLWPGEVYLYVGVENVFGDAVLLQIDTAAPDPNIVLQKEVLETSPGVIGPPSLDNVHDIIHVGSEAGILYAVKVPLVSS